MEVIMLDILREPNKEKTYSKEGLMLKSKSLEEAGLLLQSKVVKLISLDYIPITTDNIIKFLQKKSEERWGRMRMDDPTISQDKIIIDIRVDLPHVWGHVTWTEIPLTDYQEIPPAQIVEKVSETNKTGLFDYLTVAKFSYKTEIVKDPLLLGRITNSDIRFFIAQWEDDIHLDDLI